MSSSATSRRQFARNLLATGATAIAVLPARLALGTPSAIPWIDTNVSLGTWPTRSLPDATPDRLAKRLRHHGITQAWAGSFDALLHKDLGAVNDRLVRDCRCTDPELFVPFGSVNPILPGWREELQRCRTVHAMPGIRLFPAYHGYTLEDPRFRQLTEAAGQLGLLLQIAVTLEDERMMHPMLRAEPVDTRPLIETQARFPQARIQLVNALRTLRAKPLLDLVATGCIGVEIATLEGVGGLDSLLAQIPARHVAFGSHAPLLYFESALLKLHESNLAPDTLASLQSGAATHWLDAVRPEAPLEE